jgi:hypothetical protein
VYIRLKVAPLYNRVPGLSSKNQSENGRIKVG